MGYILRHEDYFRTIMEEQLRVESYEQIRIRRKRLESNERRIAELKRLFIKIYEDNASGRLTDECYDMLSQTYEAEQKLSALRRLSFRHPLTHFSFRACRPTLCTETPYSFASCI